MQPQITRINSDETDSNIKINLKILSVKIHLYLFRNQQNFGTSSLNYFFRADFFAVVFLAAADFCSALSIELAGNTPVWAE